MATLYVRNVPPELYAELRKWAAESGRSVNAEVLEILADHVADRRRRADWWAKVEELRATVRLPPDAPRPEDLIREDRDRGHKPDFGY